MPQWASFGLSPKDKSEPANTNKVVYMICCMKVVAKEGSISDFHSHIKMCNLL